MHAQSQFLCPIYNHCPQLSSCFLLSSSSSCFFWHLQKQHIGIFLPISSAYNLALFQLGLPDIDLAETNKQKNLVSWLDTVHFTCLCYCHLEGKQRKMDSSHSVISLKKT